MIYTVLFQTNALSHEMVHSIPTITCVDVCKCTENKNIHHKIKKKSYVDIKETIYSFMVNCCYLIRLKVKYIVFLFKKLLI